jgi:hypothetical protein
MQTKVTIRFVSGREEQFEVDFYGGTGTEARLKEFVKNPTVVLQTEKELVIIPATAIECIIMPIPESASKSIALPSVRKGRRVS